MNGNHRVIELKSDPEVFQSQWDDLKPWELRHDDRGYKVGHILVMREYLAEKDLFTGRHIVAKVIYMIKGVYTLPPDSVIMTLSVISKIDENGGPVTEMPDLGASASAFVRDFEDMMGNIHAIAEEKGWWETGKIRSNGDLLLLVVEEISEAFRALRKHNPPSEKIPGFSQVEEEVADALIRLMDMSYAYGWNIAQALVAKCEHNRSRPYRHGGLAA